MYASVIRSFTVDKYYRQKKKKKKRKKIRQKKMEDSLLQANGRYSTEITIDFS